MKPTDAKVSSALQNLATLFLKRPLTPAEEKELQNFQHNLSSQKTSVQDNTPTAKAKLLAANTIQEGRKQTDSAIRNILETLRGTTEQAIQAQEREEKAISEVLEAARSLRSLQSNPTSSPGNTEQRVEDNQAFLPQIADRLGNLVKVAVKECFDQKFSGLQGELEKALADLKAVTHPNQNKSS